MAVDDDDPPDPDDDAPVDPDDDLVDPTDVGEPVTLDALRRFLNRADTFARCRRIVRRKVPAQDVDDVVGDAVADAMRARRLPSEPRMKAWVDRVCRRAIARHFRKKNSQARFQGPMPVAPVRVDEAGLPVDDPYDDAVADIDPSVDPRKPPLRVQGLIVRRFLAEQTAKDRADRETFEIMCEHFDEDKPYEQIARERKIPAGTLHARVHRFENKYRDRAEKHRARVLPLLWLAGAFVVAVFAIVAWVLTHRAPKIEPITPEPPSPPPSASAYDPRLDIAEPPAPSSTAKPPLGPLKPGGRAPKP